MKIVLYNGLDNYNKVEDILINLLSEYDFTHLKLREMEIGYCKCCGSCGRLGYCINKDDGIKVVEEYKRNEVIIYLTNIKYGGYSKTLKKAIDRLMPIGSNSLGVKEGYMIHTIIYNGKKGIVVGIADGNKENEKEAFRELVKANYINMDWKTHNELIISNEMNSEEVEKTIYSFMKGAIKDD